MELMEMNVALRQSMCGVTLVICVLVSALSALWANTFQLRQRSPFGNIKLLSSLSC